MTEPHIGIPGIGHTAMHSSMAPISHHVSIGLHPHTAHSLVPHRDYGGSVPGLPMPTPGLQPSVTTQDPLQQGYIQRFAQMSPEQLQEVVQSMGNSPLAAIARRVLAQKRMAPQAAQSQQMVTQNQSNQSQQAMQALTPQPVAQTPIQPMQSVQSDQTAGAQPQAYRGGGMPPRRAAGGPASSMHPPHGPSTVPIMAAGGEFIVSPQYVAKVGGGDIKEGHKRLDKFVVDARRHIVNTMKGLRPPVKS